MGASRQHVLAAVMLLLVAAAPSRAVTPKVACDYRDSLCALLPRYTLGAAALGNRIYFTGGLDANDPTYPVNGSQMEFFEAPSLTPLVLQTMPSVALNTSRYRQQLVPWRGDKLVMVGGQFDDKNGASQKTMSVIVLDLATREWSLKRTFWQNNGAELIWNWARAYGDTMYMLVEDFSGVDPQTGVSRPVEEMGRRLYGLNLTGEPGHDLLGSFLVAPGLSFLQLPVTAAAQVAPGVVLVWQSGRNLASPAMDVGGKPVAWPVVVDWNGKGQSVPVSAITFKEPASLKREAGGTGGKVLSALMTSRPGSTPQLFFWSNTTAGFEGAKAPIGVAVITVFSVAVDTKPAEPAMTVTLLGAYVAPPPGHSLPQLRWVDLPLAGRVAVSEASIAEGRIVGMPYVGEVDIIRKDMDAGNVVMLETPNGVFVRGNSKPNEACPKPKGAQEDKKWQPFVMSIALPKGAGNSITMDSSSALKGTSIEAAGAFTWCTKSKENLVNGVDSIQRADMRTKGGRGMHGVAGSSKLLLVSPDTMENLDIFAEYLTKEPLKGAFVDPSSTALQLFDIKPAPSYHYPHYTSACVTTLPGNKDVYIEYGGATGFGTPKLEAISDIAAMVVPTGADPSGSIAELGGGGALPARIQPALACGPGGQAWAFGGLRDVGGKGASKWEPTADLSGIKVEAGAGGGLSKQTQAFGSGGGGAAWPAPRSGARMVYLPPDMVGLPKGALMLFGGTRTTNPDLDTSYVANITKSPLFGDAWLFDLAAQKWQPFQMRGEAPPPLMWHAMAVDGPRLLVYGGIGVDDAAGAWKKNPNLYILQFPGRTWQSAPVAQHAKGEAMTTEYPNSAIVPLSEALALEYQESIMLTTKPRSITFDGTDASIADGWAAKTAALTTGDLVVLNPKDGLLEVSQPLTISGDVTVTGAGSAQAPAKPAAGGRRLLAGAEKGTITVKCTTAGTAFRVMSAGAVLRDMSIVNCNNSAVHLLPDPSTPSGRYPEGRPVSLRAVTLSGNRGAGLRMDNGTAANLMAVAVRGNSAKGGAIEAGAGSLVNMTDCELSINLGPAVNFTGVELLAKNCNFTGNRASDGAGLWSTFIDPPAALYATEDTGTVVPPSGNIRLQGCRFEGNNATHGGGGIYVGARMAAFVSDTLFNRNLAGEGGGAHAARDGCLENLTDTRFVDNKARFLGGGLLTRAPMCTKSNMTWERIAVLNNTAEGDGGGAYVSEAAFRWLRVLDSSFSGNAAEGTRPTGRSGDGGALYLGTWSSQVWLNRTTLSGNRAARSGGGIHAILLSQDDKVDLTIADGVAANNTAGATSAGLADAATEGGALRVVGSFAALEVLGSNFTGNEAGQGGAISFGADRGSVTVAGGRFIDNAALAAGGALLAGESSDAILTNVTFIDNAASVRAAGPEWSSEGLRDDAAGGGFCCYRCNSVQLKGCTFRGNHAGRFGGGAAVLLPFTGASFNDTVFEANSAARPIAVSRRRLQQVPALVRAHACNDESACKDVEEGFKLGGWATTIDAGNTTGDDGKYTGGGGLYLSLQGAVKMEGCQFKNNSAESGGGMIARTDLCRNTKDSGCKLSLLGKSNSFVCNTAGTGGAGGGLLLTKLDKALVELPDSACGGSLGLKSFRACLGAGAGGAAACKPAAAAPAKGRGLLAAPEPQGELMIEPLNAVGIGGYGEDLASAATTAHFLRVSNATIGELPTTYHAFSAPGNPVPVEVLLRDDLGRNVTGTISDASMLMQATLKHMNGSSADNVVRQGNMSRAFNGVALFPVLQVFARPGNYVVEFVPLDPGNRVLRPASLNLTLRHCMVGESATSLTASDEQLRRAGVDFRCEFCRFGTYSVDPDYGSCVQCDAKTNANCTGVAPVPLDGYWVSHPRSPLVHRCLVDAACKKTRSRRYGNAAGDAMFNWATRYKAKTVPELAVRNATTGRRLYEEYTAMQCSDGYQGTLCGECAADWGRRGHRCIECNTHRSLSHAFYFLAVAYLVVLVFLAGFMHCRQVERRTRKAAVEDQATFAAGLSGDAPGGGGGAKGGFTVNGAPKAGEAYGPPAERVPGAEGTEDYGIDIAPKSGSDQMRTNSIGDGRTPFESHTFAALGDSHTSASFAPREGLRSVSEDWAANGGGGGAAANGAAGGGGNARPWSASTQGSRSGRSWLNAMFSADTLRERAGTLHASSAAGKGEGAASVKPRFRGQRFWVSSILKLLISHLQLLGLLRGLRINWPESVNTALVFFDQTSTVSSWVSLDCSLGNDRPGHVRRSIKRTLIMLLLPVAGLLLGLIYWGGHALIVKSMSQRRPALRRLTWQRYYQPRIVLTVVLIMFYLYPQVSDAVVSIFACTPLDADLLPFRGEAAASVAAFMRKTGALVANATSGYWNQDTHYVCHRGDHAWLTGLGAIWMVAFCVGFPVAMVASLWVVRGKLDDEDVDMRYGFFYDSYDPKYFYWESVILVEKLLMVVAITLLQRKNATVQVLVALIIISSATVAQITFRPSGCKMLHTLQRLSFFVLQATLFLLMVSNLEEIATRQVVMFALILAAVFNVFLVAVFVYAFVIELHRMLLATVGKEPGQRLTWDDFKAVVRDTVLGPCGGRGGPGDAGAATRRGGGGGGAAAVQGSVRPSGEAGIGGGAAGGAGRRGGPPQESISGLPV